MREAKRTNFKGTPEGDFRSLKMDVEDVESNLKTSKKYLESAWEAFNQVKADIDAEKWSHKVRVTAITTRCIAAITIGGG